MKKYVVVFMLLTCTIQLTFAQKPPLRVAIAPFSPPFVMRSELNQYYGFDIATIEYICRALDRSCTYLPMDADNLIPSLQAQQADVAIGGLVRTIATVARVRFSIPYLVSQGQFMTTNQALFTYPFKIKQLSRKSIGVINGSAFEEIIAKTRLYKPSIIKFDRASDMIAALHANTLDIALMSLLQADYWQTHSNGELKRIGQPFLMGRGFSIAIDPIQLLLQQEINNAIIQYQESTEYKRNYHLYFPESF